MLNQYDRKRIKGELDLRNFMIDVHPNDIKIQGAEWISLNNDPSVRIKRGNSKWHDFSTKRDKLDSFGDGIALLTDFLGYEFKDATKELLDYLDGKIVPVERAKIDTSKKIEPREYELPQKSSRYPNVVYAYLGKTRHIPYEILDKLIKTGAVYQQDVPYKDRVIHNVVFSTPKGNFYEIRGCNTVGNVFHQSMAKTENDCFSIGKAKDPKKIYVTEASIDAISLLSLHMLHNEPLGLYLGLGGIEKQQPIEYFKKCYPNAEIVIAVDNDAAGDKVREKYKDIYNSIIPRNKDWNEDLCEEFTNTSKEDKKEN